MQSPPSSWLASSSRPQTCSAYAHVPGVCKVFVWRVPAKAVRGWPTLRNSPVLKMRVHVFRVHARPQHSFDMNAGKGRLP